MLPTHGERHSTVSAQDQEKFEDRFRAAVSESLGAARAGEDVRKRLQARLKSEAPGTVPEGVSEEGVSRLEFQLQQAVARSSEWSAPDEVALRTEQAVSEEAGQDLLSERSVHALLEGESEGLVSSEKARYLKAFRESLREGLGAQEAPEGVRSRLVATIRQEANKVVAIDSSARRSAWGRPATAILSLAASLAVVLGLFLGGAETALAKNVRGDHQHCAAMAGKVTPRPTFARTLASRYGEVPDPPVDPIWELRVTNLCPDSTGRAMVHYVYSKETNGKVETLSIHFIPPSQNARNLKVADVEDLHEVEQGQFPVLAWRQGAWLCTACSPELDADALRAALTI